MNTQQREITEEEKSIDTALKKIIGNVIFEAPLSGEDVEKFIDVETIEGKITQLKELVVKAKTLENASKELFLTQQKNFLLNAHWDLTRGKFFSSLDDVWDKISMPFDSTDVSVDLFKRESHAGDCYKTKAEGAADPDCQVTDHSGSSKASTASKASDGSIEMLPNIFGADNAKFQSAHLMPNSPHCASCWYHFVPWVLHTTDIDTASHTNESRWGYMKKCIHGFSAAESTDCNEAHQIAPEEETKRKNTDKNTTIQPKSNSKDKEIALEANVSNDNTNIDASGGTGGGQKRRRKNNVGIRHFGTNRILLADQAEYLDKYHCVLIIPILDAAEVKDWKVGKAYNAIVLATAFRRGASTKDTPASVVYTHIEAFTGPLHFANELECSKACDLLKSMVLCVCKSFKETFPQEFLLEKNKSKTEDLQRAWESLNLHQTQEKPSEVSVPTVKTGTNGIRNVRKIQFSKDNPAPDPVLLLGKSTSNWLKLQGLVILPGCCDDDDSTSDSSSYGVSLSSHESAAQVLLHKKLCVEEIRLFPCDTVDESLSDEDDEAL